MNLVRPVLERLFRRGESAARRGDPTDATLPMTVASCPEYAGLTSLDELERFHAEVVAAEREGAIDVQRDTHRGDGTRLKRLKVRDLGKLASLLELPLHAEALARANALFAAWIDHFPVLAAVQFTWAEGRKVRSQGPDAVNDLCDALRVADEAGRATDGERMLRRESVRLFGDSKRIEALTPWLDLLAAGDLASSGLSREEVWSAFGLRREPQPMLLAGNARIRADGREIELLSPYLGLPPERIELLLAPVEFVLTIENLASFHDAARITDPRPRLIIYTGGMPSPTWRKAWSRLLSALPPTTPLFHWGDIDEGGFRIARVLVATATATGHSLLAWMMSPESVPQGTLESCNAPSQTTLARMCEAATSCGWVAISNSLRERPLVVEQEALMATLP